MSDPKIVASARSQGRPPVEPAEFNRAWAVLGWIGIAFLLVGGADFLFAWFPLNLGNREWEFGTATASFNGLPILLLGLGLLIASAELIRRRWWAALGLGAAALLLLWILIGSALWAGSVSVALRTVPSEMAMGVRKAVAKTALQSVCYSVLLAYLMWKGWGAAKGEVQD